MRDIYIMRIVLYTLKCILLYRVNADMVDLLLLEKNSFSLCPPWCAALSGFALGHCGGEEGAIKKDNNLFLKPINTDIYGTIIEQADL